MNHIINFLYSINKIPFVGQLLSGLVGILTAIISVKLSAKETRKDLKRKERPYLKVTRNSNRLIVKNVSDSSCYDIKCEIKIKNKFFKKEKEEKDNLLSKDLLEYKEKIELNYMEPFIDKNKLKIGKLLDGKWGRSKEELVDFLDGEISLIDGKNNRKKIQCLVERAETESGIRIAVLKGYLATLTEEINFYEIKELKISLLTNQFEKLEYKFVPQNNTSQYKWENRKEIFDKK